MGCAKPVSQDITELPITYKDLENNIPISKLKQVATTWMDPVLTILSEDILMYIEGELLALRIL